MADLEANDNWLDRPVFIVGQAKSGTSLITSLLDNHPQLAVFPVETDFYTALYPRIWTIPVLWRSRPDSKVKFFLNELRRYTHFSEMPRASELQSPASSWEKYANGLRNRLLGEKRWPKRANLFKIMAASLVKQGENDFPLSWVEKTPHHINHLAKIASDFPGAKFIFIYRDPRDNFVSYQKKHKNQKTDLSASLFAARWLYRFSQIAEIENSHRVFRLKYEDLLQHSTMRMQEIAVFLDISYHDTMLNPTQQGIPWSGNSMWGTQSTEINTETIGRYQELISNDDLRSIESICSEKMTELGYELSTNQTKAFGKVYKKSQLRNTQSISMLELLKLSKHILTGKA